MLQHLSVANLNTYENDLILLLLNGLSDDNADIQHTTAAMLEQVGLRRQKLDQEIGCM